MSSSKPENVLHIFPRQLSQEEYSELQVRHYDANCTVTDNYWRFQNFKCCAVCNGPRDPNDAP